MARIPLPRLDRASLLAATLVAAGMNALFAKFADNVELYGWGGAAASLFGVSAVLWIALVALIDLAGDGRGAQPERADWWLCGVVLASCLLPTGREAGLAMLGVSAISMFRFVHGSRERRIGVVGLALTGPLVFAPIVMAYLAPEILRFDAAFVSWLSGHPSNGNVVEFTDPAMRAAGKQMVIFVGCSSVHNMSLVCVLFAVVTQTLNVRLTKSMWLLVAAMVAAIAAINVGRLTAIALMPQHFEMLHSGWGAQMFSLAGLAGAGAIILAGALRNMEQRHG